MLLNDGNVIYLGNNGIETRSFTSVQCFFDFESDDYWLIEFASGNCLHQAYLSGDLVEKIKNGRAKLLLNNSHEAFHDAVEPIYAKFVQGMGIPPKQIVLLSESASIHQVIHKAAEKYGSEPISAYWIRVFEYDVRTTSEFDPAYKEITTLESKPYLKKFLNLNRRWRPHRPMLVGLLASRNLIDRGFVSLARHVEGHSWDNMWNVLCFHQSLYETEIHKELLDNREKIEALPDLYIDTTDLQTNQAVVNNNLDEHYRNTYFSVVSETNFFREFGEGVFVSEKIFKPILKKHPFISVARPHTLKELKRIGYKTFHPYIDESYDSIENDADRLMAIVNEIERLCNLNDEQLVEYLVALREITEYNYRVLQNKRGMEHCNRLI